MTRKSVTVAAISATAVTAACTRTAPKATLSIHLLRIWWLSILSI